MQLNDTPTYFLITMSTDTASTRHLNFPTTKWTDKEHYDFLSLHWENVIYLIKFSQTPPTIFFLCMFSRYSLNELQKT